ncbi:hypothetical protein TWF718_003606 [Orbilia javanica]|uniref:Uncharacterized protein n=1 Tax=Orbilia javanica TaxID=47235 RepID=A0AAN8MWP9_9PEZI
MWGIMWIWLSLIPKVLAPANRAPGCGGEPATINRRDFDDFFREERGNLQVLAKAIEEIDYLQEEGRCPSDVAYITVFHRDTSFHIQPLIDRLFNARLELGRLITEYAEDEAEGYGTFFDEAELRLIYNTIRNLEVLAEAEKDAVDGFVADIANLPRLRYPDENDQNTNLLNLAMGIDDGRPDGEYLVEYTLGARQNLQARFDSLIEKMELAVSDYDNELAVHDTRDRGQLDEWLPKGNSYQDVIGALIRWSMCWAEGVKGAAGALRTIAPAPGPEDPRPSRWGVVGRGLSRIGRSLSGLGIGAGCRGRSRTPPPARRNNNN